MSDEENRRELRESLSGNPSTRRLVEVERLASALSETLRLALNGPNGGGQRLVFDPESRYPVECLLFFWKHGEGIAFDFERDGVWIEGPAPRFFALVTCHAHNRTTGERCTREPRHPGDHTGPFRPNSTRRIWSTPV